MLKTQSNEWLLKETNTGFLQSPTEQQNNLAAHINYGFVSSTNSLSWPSVDDCRYALTPALPQKCDSDVGQGHIPCTLECSTSTKPSDCSLKSRKRKRDPSPGTCKRPRSCYDQAPVENEKENNELPPPYKGFEDIPFGTPAGEEYWTDEELNKAIAIDEEASECKENKVVSIQKYGYNKLDQDLETKLGKNLKAFQRYIEKCVKPTDMIVFFDKFSPEQRKLLQQTKSKYTIKANRQIFDVINAMKDTPDKYTSILHACEEGGYPKVSEILMGRLAPKSRKHRQTISKAAKHIYQRLSVCDVMPYLLQKGVINTFDMQEVKATAATCEAAIELLLLLPNRSRQWYCLLIEALVESNQCELAQLIDKKMTEEIQENTYNRSLCSTSLESVCKATPQTPLTDIVLEHPIRDSIIYLETLPEEPDDVHYGPQYHIQLTRFASFRKSLKKTYRSIVKFPFKRKGLTGQ